MTTPPPDELPTIWRYKTAFVSGCVAGLVFALKGFIDPDSPADNLAQWPFLAMAVHVVSICTAIAAFAMFGVFVRNVVIQEVRTRAKSAVRKPARPAAGTPDS